MLELLGAVVDELLRAFGWGHKTKVPSVVGRDVAGARQTLQHSKLVWVTNLSEDEDNTADGTVADQSPAAGTKVRKGSIVRLTIERSA